MLRCFLVPSFIAAVFMYGAVGYGGFLLLRPMTATQTTIEHAWAGDIPAQQHVALCYAKGRCADLGYAPVLGCAWRQIVVEQTGNDSRAKRDAEEACGVIDPSLSSTVSDAKDDILARLSRARQMADASHPLQASAHP